MKFYVACFLLLCFFACDDEKEVEDVRQEMQEIELAIEALTQLDCTSSSQCAATPIGVKACGGPTHYVIHNTATDVVALAELIDRYNVLNRTLNSLTGAISDCSIVNPPTLTCMNGICQEEG